MASNVIIFVPMSQLPHRVREMRKKADKSIDDMAAHLGMKPPHVSMMERGLRPLHLDRMKEIADYLGCSVADLLDDRDNPDRLPEEIAEVVHNLEKLAPEDVQKVKDITAMFVPMPLRRANGDG